MHLKFVKSYSLVTVFATALTSALNVPPQIRSSHAFVCGNRSATRAHPIISQSFTHGPCVPPPTIAFTAILLLPDNVNERDRFEPIFFKKDYNAEKVHTFQKQLTQSIFTSCILNATEIAFCTNADAIILIWQLTANIYIEIETFYLSINTSIELQASRIGFGNACAFNLWYTDAPHSRKWCTAWYDRQHNWVTATHTGVDVHWRYIGNKFAWNSRRTEIR